MLAQANASSELAFSLIQQAETALALLSHICAIIWGFFLFRKTTHTLITPRPTAAFLYLNAQDWGRPQIDVYKFPRDYS